MISIIQPNRKHLRSSSTSSNGSCSSSGSLILFPEDAAQTEPPAGLVRTREAYRIAVVVAVAVAVAVVVSVVRAVVV